MLRVWESQSRLPMQTMLSKAPGMMECIEFRQLLPKAPTMTSQTFPSRHLLGANIQGKHCLLPELGWLIKSNIKRIASGDWVPAVKARLAIQ